MTNEQRNEVWQKATKIVERNHQPEQARGMGQRVEFQKIISRLLTNPKDKEVEPLIATEAKILSIPIVFDCWIRNNETVDSLMAKLPTNYFD